MTAAKTRFRRSKTVLWRSCPGSILVLPRGASAPLELSGPAVDLWLMLEKPQTLSATVRRLAKRFDMDAEQVTASIEPVLHQLLDARALEPVS